MKATTTTKRQHSGRIEVRPALKHLADLMATWRNVYERACEFDGLPPDTTFAVFSEFNPYTQFVNRAALNFMEAKRTYMSGGYVGLQITSRKGKHES